MSTFGYSMECVGRALEELVTEGTLKDRLRKAGLQLSAAPLGEVPDDIKQDLQEVMRKLRQIETVTALTPQQAEDLPTTIIAIHGRMWFHEGKTSRS